MPTAKDVHVNAALSNFAVKKGVGGGFVADELFPVVPVKKNSDEYYVYAQDEMDDDVETAVSERELANEIDWSTSTAEYLLVKHKLRHFVSDDVMANADKPLRPKMRATELLVRRLRMGVEKRVRDLVVDTTTITNATPAVKWDAGAAVVIEKNIDDAKEAFAVAAGVEPNIIVIPPAVAKVMKRDSTVRELIKYTQSNLLVNGDLPPTVFNLRVVIPGALANSANAGLTQNVARLWSDDKVILAYVEPNPGTEAMTAGVQVRKTHGQTAKGVQMTIPVKEYRVPGLDGVFVEAGFKVDEVVVCSDALYILNDVLT